jgi:hypothetical protein
MIYWFMMKWHGYWWEHYFRIYAYNDAHSCTEKKMNYHWELFIAYDEYMRRKKNGKSK